MKEHPSTPGRVPVSCVIKVYMTRWQTDSGRAGGPAHRAADADSLIALTVHVCKCVCASAHLQQSNWITKPC